MDVKDYIHISRHSLEEFVNIFTYKKVSIRKKHWVYLIEKNKLICPITQKKVTHCYFDLHKKNNTNHYNFYGENDELFTIDHIKPKAKGGTNDFDNVQPMIAEENFKKSDSYS
jgi:hypothetical protein